MIVYKYVPLDAGMKILTTNSIGFTKPHHFNDPFELKAGYPRPNEEDPLAELFGGIIKNAKTHIWSSTSGVLSLTRTPLNPLMWAHYCQEHTGLVIGLDASITEFTAEATNLIPIQYGSMIYTRSRPNHNFISGFITPLALGKTHEFPRDHLEKLQRLFLTKASYWSYEEEVRVVKCLHGIDKNSSIPSGKFDIVEEAKRKLHLLKLPSKAIQEVYIGVEYGDACGGNLESLANEIASLQPQATIKLCSLQSATWELTAKDA